MFCTTCATFNPVPGAPCAACGHATMAPAVNAARPRSRRSAQRRRRMLRLLYMLPVLALLVGGGIGTSRYRAEQAALAKWYERGEDAAVAGRLPEAIDAYAAAAGYRDADARYAAAVEQLAPYRADYLNGLAALEDERFDEAIADLLPVARALPDYRDTVNRLAEARAGRLDVLRRTAADAEGRGDWLAAERALAEIAAADPDDRDTAERLATLRREHAPMVFARDEALYLIGPDGNDERLVTNEVPVAWPAWSPDRTRIAFVSLDRTTAGSDTALYVIDVDGTHLRQLAERVYVYPPPVWSPDGTKLAYTSFSGWDATLGQGTISVRVADVESGRETDLTGDALKIALGPSWSPTSDRLSFISKEFRPGRRISDNPGDIYLIDLNDRSLTNLSRGLVPNAWAVAWSPIDERILVQTYGDAEWTGGDQSWSDSEETSLKLLDAVTGDVSTVITASEDVSMPIWSPDGRSFAFVEAASVVRIRGEDDGEIWVNVTTPVSPFLSWSPDGSMLVAPALNPAEPSMLIPLGDRPAPITSLDVRFDADNPTLGPPRWSPTHLAGPAGAPSIGGTARDYGRAGVGSER